MQIGPSEKDDRRRIAEAILLRRRMIEGDSRKVNWTWRRMKERTTEIWKRSDNDER